MQNHAEIWFQALTKDHEASLKKQQDDVNALRRQLDHVISFTKWATGSQSGTALLYCKRLVCTTAFRIDYPMVVSAACLRKTMFTYLLPSGVATATHLSQSNAVLCILSFCQNPTIEFWNLSLSPRSFFRCIIWWEQAAVLPSSHRI